MSPSGWQRTRGANGKINWDWDCQTLQRLHCPKGDAPAPPETFTIPKLFLGQPGSCKASLVNLGKTRTELPVLDLLTNKFLLRDERIKTVSVWAVLSTPPLDFSRALLQSHPLPSAFPFLTTEQSAQGESCCLDPEVQQNSSFLHQC